MGIKTYHFALNNTIITCITTTTTTLKGTWVWIRLPFVLEEMVG